jgi:putative phage-type endonuclease
MTEINSQLIDVTDLIIPEEDPKYFNDEETLELYQTCTSLMEEFIRHHPALISEPDFEDIFDENIHNLMHSHFDFDIFYTDDAEDEMDEIIEYVKNDFFKHFMPPRSYPDSIIIEEPDFDYISEQLDVLRNKPQPTQRTKEWYEFRHNLITASNAYKAFESQTVKNQLIYEKCQPLNQSLFVDNEVENEETKEIKEVVMVNTNTTLHWGQKYEPLSVKIYQHNYETNIEDFGCIQHEKYLFLGASPDGINVDPNSKRYGRMLEIKNIVNREIDGIPKKEYWIQMQLQMEVCDLDECDFLETKFIEYPDFISYKDDTTEELYEDEEGIEFENVSLSKDNKMKGSIIYFHTKEGNPFYVYRPLDLIHPDDITQWEENIVDHYQYNPELNYTYMKTIYWKLEHLSCVLVCRNRQWFKDNISSLEEIWTTIEKERVSGYEHRAPNRKQKKETVDLTTKPSGGCLLQFNKETGKITVVKKDIETTTTIPIVIPELKAIDINFNTFNNDT